MGQPGLQGLPGHSISEAEIRDICANVLRGDFICSSIMIALTTIRSHDEASIKVRQSLIHSFLFCEETINNLIEI